jgi:hypothetical protein
MRIDRPVGPLITTSPRSSTVAVAVFITAILTALLVGGGIYLWQQGEYQELVATYDEQLKLLMHQSPVPSSQVAPTLSPHPSFITSDLTTWQTLKGTVAKTTVTFKYPPDWKRDAVSDRWRQLIGDFNDMVYKVKDPTGATVYPLQAAITFGTPEEIALVPEDSSKWGVQTLDNGTKIVRSGKRITKTIKGDSVMAETVYVSTPTGASLAFAALYFDEAYSPQASDIFENILSTIEVAGS